MEQFVVVIVLYLQANYVLSVLVNFIIVNYLESVHKQFRSLWDWLLPAV